jgi:uncharacterized protein (TIGR03437 family)
VVDGQRVLTPIRYQSFTSGTTHTLTVDGPTYDSTSNSRLVFDGWEDGTLASARTVQIPAELGVYRASFHRQHYLNWEWQGPGALTVNPGGFDGDYYDEGSTVTVSANARGSSALQYWLGDAVSGSLTQPLVITRSKWIYGVFGNPIDFRPVNAASFSANPTFNQAATYVAPLEIISLFGNNVGPATGTLGVLDGNGRLATTLGNTRVLFDGIPAPIAYASAGQTNVVVPVEVSGRIFTVSQVERNGVLAGTTTASITNSLPGLFAVAGTGNVAGTNEDGSYNSASRPAAAESVVTLYATGGGTTDLSLPNGAVTGSPLPRLRQPVSVRIGTQTAEVLYAGPLPNFVHGALQINVRIPAGLEPGSQPIKVVIGSNASAPGTTIAVQ